MFHSTPTGIIATTIELDFNYLLCSPEKAMGVAEVRPQTNKRFQVTTVKRVASS